MSKESIPKRRPTDPIPGTKGPQRGSNEAIKVNTALERVEQPTPEPLAKLPWSGRERRKLIDSEVEKAQTAFKSGGQVRGWGKARKR